MTTDELADRVEAGLRDGLAWVPHDVVSHDITDALAALADYRKRVQALEAEYWRVRKLREQLTDLAEIIMSCNPDDYAIEEHATIMRSWARSANFILTAEARALLAGSEGGDGLPDVSGVWWTLTATDQAEMLAIANGQQPADVSKTLLVRNMVYFDDLNKFGITDYGKRVMAGRTP